ncbi:hypothetical protein GN956_G23342 [Arapaima gigas]
MARTRRKARRRLSPERGQDVISRGRRWNAGAGSHHVAREIIRGEKQLPQSEIPGVKGPSIQEDHGWALSVAIL